MRLTVAIETPVADAMWAPVRRHRRRETIRSTTCPGVGLRMRRGLEERSGMPAGLKSRKRPTHLDTVLGATPNDLAASRRLRRSALWPSGSGPSVRARRPPGPPIEAARRDMPSSDGRQRARATPSRALADTRRGYGGTGMLDQAPRAQGQQVEAVRDRDRAAPSPARPRPTAPPNTSSRQPCSSRTGQALQDIGATWHRLCQRARACTRHRPRAALGVGPPISRSRLDRDSYRSSATAGQSIEPVRILGLPINRQKDKPRHCQPHAH